MSSQSLPTNICWGIIWIIHDLIVCTFLLLRQFSGRCHSNRLQKIQRLRNLHRTLKIHVDVVTSATNPLDFVFRMRLLRSRTTFDLSVSLRDGDGGDRCQVDVRFVTLNMSQHVYGHWIENKTLFLQTREMSLYVYPMSCQNKAWHIYLLKNVQCVSMTTCHPTILYTCPMDQRASFTFGMCNRHCMSTVVMP